MSVDVASLSISVNSSDATKATKDLDNLTKSGERATTGIGKIGPSASSAGKSANDLGNNVRDLKDKLNGLGDAQSGIDKIAGSFMSLEGVIGKLAAAFAAVKILDWGKETVLLAARYETLGVAMNVVGKNAGYTATEMAWFQRSLEATGISMVESRNNLARMAAAQLDLTKAAQMGRVAQDAAVIAGINSSEAFERLIQGIVSGQPRILHTMGIFADFAQAEKLWAKEHGKTMETLTNEEKVQIRFNATLAEGSKRAGAYEAAMETAGKQLKSMERYAQDAQVQLGDVFQPALNVLVADLSHSLKGTSEWMVKNKEATSELGIAMAEVVRQSDSFIAMLGKIAGGSEGASGSVSILTRGSQLLALGIADVTVAFGWFVGGASVGIATLTKLWDELAKKVTGGSGSGLAGWAKSLMDYGMQFFKGKNAIDEFNDRTFATRPRNFADWTKAGISDSEGGEGADPYGVMSERARLAGEKSKEADAEKFKERLDKEREFVDKLGMSYAKLVLTQGELLDLEIKRANLTPTMKVYAEFMASMIRDAGAYKPLEDYKPKITVDFTVFKDEANTGWKKFQDDFEKAQGLVDPKRGEMKGIKDDIALVEKYSALLGDEGVAGAMKNLQKRDMEMKANMGDTWASMAVEIQTFSNRSSDAFVEFAMTGKASFSDLISSMLRDLARLAAQKAFFGPLFDYLGKEFFGLFNPSGSNPVSGGGAMDDPGLIPRGSSNSFTPPMAAPAASSTSVAPVVNVTVNNQGGAETTSTQGGKAGLDLAKAIEPVLNDWALRQSRVGGLLAARTA